MSAFRTTEAVGRCAADCGWPIEQGELVVMVNDELVHLHCENPEREIAKTMSFDVDHAPSHEERADEAANCDHVCPECREGKHRNCDGYAWCATTDNRAVCSCQASGHRPAVSSLVERLAAMPAGIGADRAQLAAEARERTAAARLEVARKVAAHWHAAAVTSSAVEAGSPWAVAGHALSLVLAALDGETDPGRLGVAPEVLS